MNHIGYINFFEECAKTHPDIRHEHEGRKSFYRTMFEEEFTFPETGSSPCLILYNYRGRLESGTAVKDTMTAGFEVRGRVSDPTDFDAIETLKANCKRIGFDIIAKIQTEMDDEPKTGRIPGFNIESVQYSFTGVTGDAEFGCYFFFLMSDIAFNPFTFDTDATFNA